MDWLWWTPWCCANRQGGGIPKHAQLAPSLCNHLAQLLVRVHGVVSQGPACLSNIGGRATCTWYLVHDSSCLIFRDAVLWAHQHLLQCHVWPQGDSHSQRGRDASYHLWDTSHVGGCHTWASSFLLWSARPIRGGLEWHKITSFRYPLKVRACLRCFFSLSMANTDERMASALLWSVIFLIFPWLMNSDYKDQSCLYLATKVSSHIEHCIVRLPGTEHGKITWFILISHMHQS